MRSSSGAPGGGPSRSKTKMWHAVLAVSSCSPIITSRWAGWRVRREARAIGVARAAIAPRTRRGGAALGLQEDFCRTTSAARPRCGARQRARGVQRAARGVRTVRCVARAARGARRAVRVWCAPP
eukprot:3923908-Prymnesium_polylepis.2